VAFFDTKNTSSLGENAGFDDLEKLRRAAFVFCVFNPDFGQVFILYHNGGRNLIIWRAQGISSVY